MWRGLRAVGWPIISTWIDEAVSPSPAYLRELWARIDREVRSSCGLVVYAESQDVPLRDALVEVGIALGAGLPVAAVFPGVELDARSFHPAGSWFRHPLVRRWDSVGDAIRHLLARRDRANVR